ncbi:hypothetical protein OPQ81_007920 [Rhizoctonia solani]|nr:hypothetical protein OPQ81_007920 [Rhizoctonia solani]
MNFDARKLKALSVRNYKIGDRPSSYPASTHPTDVFPCPIIQSKAKSIVSAGLLSAVAVSAVPGLILDVNVLGPSSAVDVDRLIPKAVLKNTGTESLKLLNDPRTVLSKAPTDTFSITANYSSQTHKFTGIKLKYLPATATAKAQDADLIALAPGQSIEIDHSLAGVYNFTSAREGTYKIFNYVDASGELKTIEGSSNLKQFKLAGNLVAPGARTSAARGVSKRGIGYSGCNSSQQNLISAAAAAANTNVANANAYLNGISSDTTRYTTWFGSYTTARLSTVRLYFTAVGTDATPTTCDWTTSQNTPGIDYGSIMITCTVMNQGRSTSAVSFGVPSHWHRLACGNHCPRKLSL